MKPRLRLKGGVWSCVSWHVVERVNSFSAGFMVAGYGYTPIDAYADWWDRR